MESKERLYLKAENNESRGQKERDVEMRLGALYTHFSVLKIAASTQASSMQSSVTWNPRSELCAMGL